MTTESDIAAAARGASAMFRLPVRDAAWRGPQGGVSGRGAGSSPDFEDHRPYFPGDDVRHINWQAYARTGTYTMKVFRAEVSLSVDLMVDLSPSMFLDESKSRRTREIVRFCVESAGKIGATLRIHAMEGESVRPVSREAVMAGDWGPGFVSGAPMGAPPAIGRVAFRQGSMRVLVSDLLFPVNESVFIPLTANRGRAVVFSPACRAESAPDWGGNHEFEDVETGRVETVLVSPSTASRYAAAYARHFELWRDVAKRRGVRFARLDAETPLSEMLRRDALPTGAVEACL